MRLVPDEQDHRRRVRLQLSENLFGIAGRLERLRLAQLRRSDAGRGPPARRSAARADRARSESARFPGSSSASPRATSRARRWPSSLGARSASRPDSAGIHLGGGWRRSQISILPECSRVSLRRYVPGNPSAGLGPYEVLAPLGRGGMGEVYRAREPRLEREVALKMLRGRGGAPTAARGSSGRPGDRGPAIIPTSWPIHDTASSTRVPYAVTELLEGETLRRPPARPASRDAKAVDVACQVAERPGRGPRPRDHPPRRQARQRFLTPRRSGKILDFGIARIEQPAPDPRYAGGPARAARSSQFLVGTAGYMSPEQVAGRADRRAHRHLFARRHVLRDADRSAGVSRETPAGPSGPCSAATSQPPGDREDYSGGGGVRSPVPRKGPRGPLPVGPGPAAGPSRLSGGAGARGLRARQFPSEPPWKHRRTRVILRAIGGVVLFALGLWAGSCWERGRRRERRCRVAVPAD